MITMELTEDEVKLIERRREFFKSNEKLPKEFRHRWIYCITTDEVFATTNDAVLMYRVEGGNIKKCCDGKLKSAGRCGAVKLKWTKTIPEGRSPNK